MAVVVALLCCAASATAAQAATYTVGTTADTTGTCVNPATDTCSLRQLINYENNLFPPPSPADTIVVPANTTQNPAYSLTNGALTIFKSMSILGAGARTTFVDQTPSTPDRVFAVKLSEGGPTPNVFISGLTIERGTAPAGTPGGDVYNQGILTLSEDTIRFGSVSQSVGGGAANDGGTMTVTHSFVWQNFANQGSSAPIGDGGGLANTGPNPVTGAPGQLVVDNSTIATNTAAQFGGGIVDEADASNTTKVTSSTIAFNDGGAGVGAAGGLQSRNVGGTMTVQGSIVASNTVSPGGTSSPSNCGSGISSSGYNLETGTDCGFAATGDLQNTDPKFNSFNAGTPQNNGGNTDTLGFDASSPAVDAIPASASFCNGTDQRDLSRPQGARCDIGAFELFEPVEGTQSTIQVGYQNCFPPIRRSPRNGGDPPFTVVWGDGSQSSGSLPNNIESVPIDAVHAYAATGTYNNGTVTWTDACGPHTQSFAVKVLDAPLTAAGTSVSATSGGQFSGEVATFTDGNQLATPAQFSPVTISWGDGSSSPGTVSAGAGAGNFVINGTHTYAASGSYTIAVSVLDVGGQTAAANSTATVASSKPPTQKPTVSTGPPRVDSSTGAGFSGTVGPGGLPTTVQFEYGIDVRYRVAAIIYDQSTPVQQVGSDFSSHNVSAIVSGLIPNALYHVRLVASNGAGTAFGPDQTFMTKKDPPPPPPTLGKSFNVVPISGIVFVKPPNGQTLRAFASNASTPLVKGAGFIPLTEARQLPTGSEIDARRGTLKLIAATGHPGKTQSGTFSTGLFKLGQDRRGLHKGLTTLSLLEGAFPGAPTYATCKAHSATDNPGPTAQTARLSNRILQTLHARDNHGRFRTRGRYSAATVRGTKWDTTDRCDGTLTIVHRGTVLVTDFHRHKTITLHAGHSYLAHAIKNLHHK